MMSRSVGVLTFKVPGFFIGCLFLGGGGRDRVSVLRISILPTDRPGARSSLPRISETSPENRWLAPAVWLRACTGAFVPRRGGGPIEPPPEPQPACSLRQMTFEPKPPVRSDC